METIYLIERNNGVRGYINQADLNKLIENKVEHEVIDRKLVD